jgi:phosphatidylinositol alpha-1,6-mannosyltransferase
METYSVELTRELAQLGELELALQVLPGRTDGRTPPKIAIAGFFVKSLLRLWRDRRYYDLVHFGDFALFPLAWWNRVISRNTRNVISLHGLDVIYGRRSGLAPMLYRIFVAWARGRRCVDRFIANSRNTARLLTEQGFSPISVVPLGVRLKDPSNAPAISAIGRERYVLFFGRIFRRKGILWFAKNVLPGLPDDVKLYVVGTIWDPKEGEALRNNPRVNMLGAFPLDLSVAQFEELKRKAVAIVMPNVKNPDGKDVEGFGLTALEAADGGAPLLASDLEGIRDAVRHGETGFLLPPEDPAAWANQILDLLSWSQSERQRFAARSRQALEKHYSWSRVAKDTCEIYSQCIKHSAANRDTC